MASSPLLRSATGLLVALAILAAPARLFAEDAPGGKDHPLLSRMLGYEIRSLEANDFDTYEFTLKGKKTVTVEGKKTAIQYQVAEGGKAASPVQIFRNCHTALAKVGGQVLYEELEQNAFGYSTVVVKKDGREAWVQVQVGNRGANYDLIIVEKQEMKQEVVSADRWRDEMGASGHAAVYGVYFDTDKSDLKPASDAALQEIATLLKRDSALSLWIVGHTDSVGEISHNIRLSEQRAKAVVAALSTRFGVATSRLSAHGVGPLCPVASNESDEGRGRNRRVELVRR